MRQSKIWPIIMIIAGFVMFLSNFLQSRNTNLGELKLDDVYSLVLGIGLMMAGIIALKRIDKLQK